MSTFWLEQQFSLTNPAACGAKSLPREFSAPPRGSQIFSFINPSSRLNMLPRRVDKSMFNGHAE